ncbi:MAG: arylamine N-acetyltransferase [Ignavibacteria bacterium]|nr:arylamine N-acetyltransferase [Ignavibacteria bacterium]
MIDLNKYLTRIKFPGEVKPDLETLFTLHRNHLYIIPFENLDIHNERKIILDPEIVQSKILDNNRGGYCYELNGLFYLLLKEIGFKVKMISARVNNGKGGWGPEFDHLAIILELENEWLVDVGFGDNFIEPLKFELDIAQENLNGFYKIVKHDEEYYKLMRSPDGTEYSDEYIFTLKERDWKEFEEMNTYHQTSPESHFTKGKICSIAKENGRISLSGSKFIVTGNGVKQEFEIKSDLEFNEKLLEHFNIRLV